MTFLEAFPTIQKLADAPENEILKKWQGLGYYSRALNIHFAAKTIQNQYKGKFPKTYDQIRNLKGIGDYTAAAIGSIAFDLPYAAVDGNVKRVAARYLGIADSVDKPATVKIITQALTEWMHGFKPGDFNQAFIELGALVCLPTNPKCAECPLQDTCVAFGQNLQSQLPVKNSKKAPKDRFVDFVFLEWKGETWIQRRDHSNIWKGLYEFPNFENLVAYDSEKPGDEIFKLLKNPNTAKVLDCFEEKHQLTHQTIFARFWHISGNPSIIVTQNKGFIKVSITALNQYPVHRLMHKYLVKKGFATHKQ